MVAQVPTQLQFLANVNSRSRSLYAVACPSVVCLSVVCNVRAPYVLSRFKFSAMFLRHLVPRPSVDTMENFAEIVPGKPSVGGVKRKSSSQIELFWTYRTLYLGNGAR